MATLLMGGETEYAIGAARNGADIQPELLRSLVNITCYDFPRSSDSGSGRFQRNGGLLYLDCGLHMEWATPECTSPHDVARYLRAGDRMIERLARKFAAESLPAEVFCSRSNVDYLAGTSWASHENYLHYSNPYRLPTQFIPFLASRLVMCGAGGWDFASPGLRFALSPRACFITEQTADESQHVRPLFHTRDEELSNTGSHRMHVACSETLCSDLGTVLRFGSTALVLAIVDAGALPAAHMQLKRPLRALRAFAADPQCRLQVPLVDGRPVTAIDIQRHYLHAVEDRLGASCLPEWAESVCALWRKTLDDLESAPEKLTGSLDWAIKQRLFADFLRRHDIDWSALPAMNAILMRLSRALGPGGGRVALEALISEHTDVARIVDSHLGRSSRSRVTREQLMTLLRVRPQLFELDMRFGELGERGIFNTLDRAGVLNHHVDGVGDIASAVDTPPRNTRAAVRGRVLQRFAEDHTHYRAEWMRIIDFNLNRVLDLRDPFEAAERWLDGTNAIRSLDRMAPDGRLTDPLEPYRRITW